MAFVEGVGYVAADEKVVISRKKGKDVVKVVKKSSSGAGSAAVGGVVAGAQLGETQYSGSGTGAAAASAVSGAVAGSQTEQKKSSSGDGSPSKAAQAAYEMSTSTPEKPGMETKTLKGQSVGEFTGSRGVPEETLKQWHEVNIARQEDEQRSAAIRRSQAELAKKKEEIEKKYYDEKVAVSPESKLGETPIVTGKENMRKKAWYSAVTPGIIEDRGLRKEEQEYAEMVKEHNKKFFWVNPEQTKTQAIAATKKQVEAKTLTIPGGGRVETQKVETRLADIKAGKPLTSDNIDVFQQEVKGTGWELHKTLTAGTTTEMFRNVPQANLQEYQASLVMQQASKEEQKYHAKETGKLALEYAGYTFGIAAAGEVIGGVMVKGGKAAKVARVLASKPIMGAFKISYGLGIAGEEYNAVIDFTGGKPTGGTIKQAHIFTKLAGIYSGTQWLKATGGKPISKLYEKTVIHPLAERRFRLMDKPFKGDKYQPPKSEFERLIENPQRGKWFEVEIFPKGYEPRGVGAYVLKNYPGTVEHGLVKGKIYINRDTMAIYRAGLTPEGTLSHEVGHKITHETDIRPITRTEASKLYQKGVIDDQTFLHIKTEYTPGEWGHEVQADVFKAAYENPAAFKAAAPDYYKEITHYVSEYAKLKGYIPGVQTTLTGKVLTQGQMEYYGLQKGFFSSYGRAPIVKPGDVQVQRQIIIENGKVSGFTPSLEQGIIPKADPSIQTRLKEDIIVGRRIVNPAEAVKIQLNTEEYEYAGSMSLNKAVVVKGQTPTVLNLRQVNQYIPEYEGLTMTRTITPQSPVYEASLQTQLLYRPPPSYSVQYVKSIPKYDVTAMFVPKVSEERLIDEIAIKTLFMPSVPAATPKPSYSTLPDLKPTPAKVITPSSVVASPKEIVNQGGGSVTIVKEAPQTGRGGMSTKELLEGLDKFDPYGLSGDRIRSGVYWTEPIMLGGSVQEPTRAIVNILPPIYSVGSSQGKATLLEPMGDVLRTPAALTKFEIKPISTTKSRTEAIVSQVSIVGTGSSIKAKAGTMTDTIQEQEQIIEPIQEIVEPIQEIVTPLVPRPIIRPPHTPPRTPRKPPTYKPDFGLPPLPKVTYGRPATGFDVFVRRRGAFLKANPSPLTEREAINFGAVRVGTTAAATFKIAKSEGRPGMTFSGLGIMSDFYRKGGLWIEKRGRRIKSPGELSEITYKGLAASRSKGRAMKRKSPQKAKNTIFGRRIKWA